MTKTEVIKKFCETYGGSENDVRVFSAAGRVNLIGEHIDYCGGSVFPAALNLRCLVAARKRTDNIIRLEATTIDSKVELDTTRLNDYRNLHWGSYQAGVAFVMQCAGYTIVGCDLLYAADIPFGSGLSSSAAIEVATAKTLSTFSGEAGGKTGDNVRLAQLSQKAENEYAGVNCGIMDQFASACGKKDRGIILNCKTLEYEYVPLNFGDYQLVIANSNKIRSLQESKYNERRAECEQALSILKTKLPQITALADVNVAEFARWRSLLRDKILDRATHVIYECERVRLSAKALHNGDIIGFGELLNQSHYSLRDLYEVTGKELDALTKFSREHTACIGSRMTGAGFGGCTVSLVKKDSVQQFILQVGKQYADEIGYPADFYETTIENGAEEL